MELIHVQKTPTNDYSENKRLEAMVWVSYTFADIENGDITVKVRDLETITGCFVQLRRAVYEVIECEDLIVTFSGNEITVHSSDFILPNEEGDQLNIFVTGR